MRLTQQTVGLSALDPGAGRFGDCEYDGKMMTSPDGMKSLSVTGSSYCVVAELWLAMTQETAEAWVRT